MREHRAGPAVSGLKILEASRTIDVNALARRGALPPGGGSTGSLAWRDQAPGLVTQVSFSAETWDLKASHLTLHYSSARTGEPVHDRIRLAVTVPTGGGIRWWFQCSCGRRCAKLYLPPGETGFRCRLCHRLTYATQRMSTTRRLRYRSEKLWARIGSPDEGLTVRFKDRPKGMHRTTYRRLRERAERYDAAADDAFESWVRRRLGHISR